MTTHTATPTQPIYRIAGRKLTATQIARRFIGDTNHPVEIVPDSDQAPASRGKGFHFTTPSGKTVIDHPNAYHWPKSYHASTLHTEVGQRWLDRFTAGNYTPADAVRCRNVEMRREIITRIGFARLVAELNLTVIDQDMVAGRRLLTFTPDANILELRDATHPDQVYHLLIPNRYDTRTCQAAVAASFGLSADSYAPAVER